MTIPSRLKSVHEAQDNVLLATQQECDTYRQKVAAFQKSSVEEIYVGQITAVGISIGVCSELSKLPETLLVIPCLIT